MFEDYKLGPKMQLLTEKQRLFVDLYIQQGCRGANRAYIESGYSPAGAQGHASRLLHTKKIQDAILEETGRRLRAHAPLALDSLMKLVENPKHKDHYLAIKTILDVSGLTSKQKVDVEVSGTVDLSWDNFKAQLEQLKMLNLPVPMLEDNED